MYVLEGSNPSDSADWEYIDFFHAQGGSGSAGASSGGGRAIEKGFGGTLLQGGPMGGGAGASSASSAGGSGSSSAGTCFLFLMDGYYIPRISGISVTNICDSI